MPMHTHLTRHIAAAAQLAKMAKIPDTIAAGYTVRVQIGKDGPTVNLSLSGDGVPVFAALIAAQAESLHVCAAMTRAELRDTQQVLAEFEAYNARCGNVN